MSHTAEPWRINSHDEKCIFSGNRIVCEVFGPCKPDVEDKANAARIVACINACAGIENPAELREQRDELLKAVQNMIALYKFNKPKHWGEGTETMISVRATLAKIKGAA